MYMKLFRKWYGVEPSGLLHVGAHLAEEAEEYLANQMCGEQKCIWIEPQKDKVEQIRNHLDDQKHEVIHALAWSETGAKLELKIASKSASSSIFEFGVHQKFYPDIENVSKIEMSSTRLDSILKPGSFNFLVLDVQGAELEVIKGLGVLIKEVDWVFTEVSREPLFVGGVDFLELNEHLANLGFRLRFVEWDKRAGWGDALYVRDSVWNNSPFLLMGRFIFWMYRRLYERIPQRCFPHLVTWKKILLRTSR